MQPGASSNLIVPPSVCPSVRLFVCNSILLTNKVQYLKFEWWYSNQTWTVGSYMGSSHFTDITCPSDGGGVKMFRRFLPYFDFVAAGGIRVSQTHVYYLFSREKVKVIGNCEVLRRCYALHCSFKLYFFCEIIADTHVSILYVLHDYRIYYCMLPQCGA